MGKILRLDSVGKGSERSRGTENGILFDKKKDAVQTCLVTKCEFSGVILEKHFKE
jgi:hypothetical protein